MEEETILEKLERLAKKRRLIKSKRIKGKKLKYGQLKYGQFENAEDDDEDADLLSQAELMEEALKMYMYQFGLSIYQNKQGDYYFKKFVEDEELRTFEELDVHHFAMRSSEPNLIEKLFEIVPEEKICLTTNIEKATLDLYYKDAVMSDILENIVEQELQKCEVILNRKEELQEQDELEPTSYKEMLNTDEKEQQSADYLKDYATQDEVFDDKVVLEDVAFEESEDVQDIEKVGKISSDTDGDSGSSADDVKFEEIYECGSSTERIERKLSKPRRIRRVAKDDMQENSVVVAAMKQDNSHNR